MLSREQRRAFNQLFWTRFEEFCETVPDLAGQKKKWILHNTKISHIDLKFDVSGNSAIVALEINHRSERRRLAVYELVERYRTLLNQGFNQEVTWDFCYLTDNGQEVCRIYTDKAGLNIYNSEEWPMIYHFMAENMLILQQNFLEIREFLQEEVQNLSRES